MQESLKRDKTNEREIQEWRIRLSDLMEKFSTATTYRNIAEDQLLLWAQYAAQDIVHTYLIVSSSSQCYWTCLPAGQ